MAILRYILPKRCYFLGKNVYLCVSLTIDSSILSPSLKHMQYPSNLSSLTPRQQKLLCLIAYMERAYDSSGKTFATKLLDATKEALEKDIKVLTDNTLIVGEINYYWEKEKSYHVAPLFRLRMLFWMYEFHPEWEQEFRKVPGGAHEDLLMIVTAVRKGTADKLEMENDGYYDDEIIEPLAWTYYEPELLPLFRNMDDELLEEILDTIKETQLSNPTGFRHFLDSLADGRKKKRMELLQSSYDYCRINEFINDGTYTDNPKGETTERGFMLQAMREAYARHIPKALASMEKALKLHNKNATGYNAEKNVFDGYITNFYMMLIYALDGSIASKKKLEVACKKKTISESQTGKPALVLGTYFKDSSMRILTDPITKCLCEKEGYYVIPDMRLLAYLLMQYLELTPQQLRFNRYYRQPDLSPENYIPTKALLRHELSPYIPISEEEKAELRKRFGGEPLLASIHRKNEWEVVLEELLQLSEQEQQKKPETHAESRLLYTIRKGSEYVEIREQKRLKNGHWSTGKQLTPNAYDRGDFEMEDVDRELWKKSMGMYHMPTAGEVISHLVGSDRVQLQKSTSDSILFAHYENFDAEVREEKPFITMERQGKNIAMKTNLPSLALLDKQFSYSIDWNNNIITYYPFTDRERLYFRKLLSLNKIPIEAEETLKKLLPAIIQEVDVNCDFIEGGTQLEEVEGSPLAIIRVQPRPDNVFQLSIFIRPLAGGKQVFQPGMGQNPAFGERDGKRVQVKRSLRKEQENARVFRDFLEEMDVDIHHDVADVGIEQILEFMEFAQQHAEQGVLEWPEETKMKMLVAQPQSWNVSLKKNAGWFDLEGELSIDEDTVMSIAQLLELLAHSDGRYIRLEGDKYLSISEQLRKQLRRIEAVSSRQHGKTVIPAVGMAVMGDALTGELEIAHPKSLDDLRSRIRKSASLKPEVPEQLNATLRDYQVDGYQWMTRLASWGAGACLADDMGLGKTVQTIAVLLDRASQGPSLVVAPASVVPNWSKEIRRFAPTLTVSILNESTDRKLLIEGLEAGHVVVSTYGLLVTEEEVLTSKKWNVICLDEAHSIKNRDTKTSASAMKLEAEQRIILTGTPIQNHLGELWNLFQFINPGLLGSYEQFQKKYIQPISQDHDTQRQQQLKRLVAPFMLRRTKQEVVEELPDKTEIIHTVELSHEEMAIYEVIRRKAKKELEDLESTGKALNVNVLAEITRLRQCACAASLADKTFAGTAFAKLDAFAQLVSDIHQAGHRTLVFSQFTSFLEMAAQRLDSLRIPYLYLDGSTPMRKRTQMVDAFQKGECPIFLISLKAGGLGLNLTGANYVIHLDPWWNPAIEQQATDRAYRIGQRQNVTVYHLIAAHTIEEKILRLHDAKRDLATSILEGTDTSHKITAAQLLQMIDEGD